MSEKRIISLLPAATEIICALGLEHQLVGRSHECDYPETVKALPVCSSAKFISGSDSAAIDKQVKDILSSALSIYEIDKHKVGELRPDVIITQAQCEVCAVSLKDVEDAMENLTDTETQIISLEPHGLEDVLKDIETLAERLDVTENGKDLLETLTERISLIKHKLKFQDHKPTVGCIEWLSPLMIAGNWTPEMVEIAGAIPVLATPGKHSPFIDFTALQEAAPDILIILPCGFSIERTLQEIRLLLDLPGWYDLAAVKNNRVYIADGNHYFNRSGPRIVDSIEILAEIIHPKQFVFGYEGQGWVKFDLSR
jgi:iron complex transport system substrate-binding protein